MAAYIARRLLLMIPTILGILLISFVIVQFAPGGPVERVLAQLQGLDQSTSGRSGAGAPPVETLQAWDLRIKEACAAVAAAVDAVAKAAPETPAA